MKKLHTIGLYIAVIGMLYAFKVVVSDKATATVEQHQGVYVFQHSKPVAEYEYLGSVKKGVAWSGKPEEMFNGLIKKCKSDFPTADGIIFTNLDMDKADCIKFK